MTAETTTKLAADVVAGDVLFDGAIVESVRVDVRWAYIITDRYHTCLRPNKTVEVQAS